MNLIDLDNQKEDLISAGFKKLDDNIIERRPPKINWGKIYKDKTPEDKIKYLENLASTMNHAAYLIQTERNQLIELCEKKESLINGLKRSMDQNMSMLQSEMIKINEERQGVNIQIAELNKKIKELEG